MALATVSNCDVIVSWNFRYLKHFEKIPRYNAVDVLNGYDPIAIHASLELPTDEDDDEAV